MKFFENLSIRKKLTLLLMGISSTAVLVACLTFYFLIVNRYQQSFLDDMKSLTAINAVNCSASLTFNLPEDAVLLLSSLNNRPSITAATIHDSAGNLFVSYSNPGVYSIKSAVNNSTNASQNTRPQIHSISHDIEINGKKIGKITLYDDMRTIRTFKNVALLMVVAIVCVVLGLTAFFAVKLEKIISQPISNLVNIAQEISTTQDYTLHAEKNSSDEIGNLVDAFNNMLCQISQKNTELRKSEYRFRTFINQAVDAFFLHDIEGRIIDVNQRACDSLGYSREELLKMTVEDIDTVADNQLYKKKYWTRMRQETPETIEGMHIRKDGESYPVEVRTGLLEISGDKMIMALARDISERLVAEKERSQLESQLHQAQKMESIGTLAGGIAHDFNNILSAVLGYTELAQTMVIGQNELSEYLDEVFKAGNRAKDLVKQILTFSRHSEYELKPLQIHLIVKEALKLLRASIPTTIEIRENIDTRNENVLADPTQIHQIMMNLCTNAYHAMRETGGVLAVELAKIEIEKGDSKVASLNLAPGS